MKILLKISTKSLHTTHEKSDRIIMFIYYIIILFLYYIFLYLYIFIIFLFYKKKIV